MRKSLFKCIAIVGLALFIPSCQKTLIQTWEKSFDEPITGVYIAQNTGNILVHTSRKICYFSASGEMLWEKGEKNNWGWIGGAGVSDDGENIIFQATPATEQATHVREFITYYLNKIGKEIWSSKSISSIAALSPNGKYIVTGSASGTSMEIYDNYGEFLWGGETGGVWDVKFDPTSHFIFINEAGIGTLYSINGKRIAKFTTGMYPHISQSAEYILTSSIELAKRGEIYLYQRNGTLLETMQGTRSCISQDGSLFMIIDNASAQLIQRTDKLILWKEKVENIGGCLISENNDSVIIISEANNMKPGYVYRLDISKGKLDKHEFAELKKVYSTSDHMYLVIQEGKNRIIALHYQEKQE